MNKRLLAFVGGASLLALGGSVQADQTWLPTRLESGTCIFNGSTQQTIETSFGAAPAWLPFSGTATYDFYSPALTAPVSLTTSDEAGGGLYMENSSTSSANDFSVKGRMRYFDYDPVTGVETLIGDTTDSTPQPILHGGNRAWQLPKALLASNFVVPAGHSLHLVVTVYLISGQPGNFGRVVYNSDRNSSTLGILPRNRGVTWSFGPLVGTPPTAAIAVSSPSVSAFTAGNTAMAPTTAGATYIWSITNGTITAGQGTSRITWTAGTASPVSLSVIVALGCSSTASTTVDVVSAPPQPSRIVSICPQPDQCMRLNCTGTPNQTYQVQATTDLGSGNWQNLGTVTSDGQGLFTLIDQDAMNFPSRFYRTVSTSP